MSRFTIPKIPFRSLTMITPVYLFLLPIDIQRHTTQKPDFPLPQDNSIWFILFSLTGATWTILDQEFQDNSNLTKALSFDKNFPSLGSPEPFRAKKTKQVQIWLKLCPLTGIPHESSLNQKNLSREFALLQHIKSASPTIKVPNLNKKEKNGKRIIILSIMHLGYLNKSKQEKSP